MYITELIGEDYKTKWKVGNKILIKAQTGSGKSTFFGNVIAQFCEEQNLHALMLSNRRLLRLQNQLLFKTNVDCFNYQTFESIVRKGKKQIDALFDKYDIIFIDECHYFFIDSAFNNNTDIVLEYVLREHKDKILIFASATPELMLQCIKKDNFDYVYEMKNDYSYIRKIIFYKEDKDVDDILRNLPPYEKSIYFAARVEDAAVNSRTFKNARFICSQYNRRFKKFSDNATYSQIVEHEKFDCKILMTTSVLDNGINIKDNRLKHILIDLMDETTVIQCVGRKRVISDTDGIILYCRVPKKQQIYGNIYGNRNRQKSSTRLSEKCLAKYISRQWEKVLKIGYEKYICDIFNYNIETALHYQADKIEDAISHILKQYKNLKLFDEEQREFMETFKEQVYNKDSTEYDRYNFKSLAANIEEYGLPYKLEKRREKSGKNRDKYYWIITENS